jgi:hypothetical protein
MHLGKFFQRGADAQGPSTCAALHGLADGGNCSASCGKGEVAVRIGEHAGSKLAKPTRADTDRQTSATLKWSA